MAQVAPPLAASSSGHLKNPLFWAARNGHVDVVIQLITQRADIDKKETHGLTALMGSTMKSHLNVVKALLERKAAVDLANPVGQTALIMATVAGNFDIAQELVRHGANVNAKDHYGDSALEFASRSGRVEIEKLLQQAAAGQVATTNNANKSNDDAPPPAKRPRFKPIEIRQEAFSAMNVPASATSTSTTSTSTSASTSSASKTVPVPAAARTKFTPKVLIEEFSRLHKWMQNSLEIYRPQFQKVCFHIFDFCCRKIAAKASKLSAKKHFFDRWAPHYQLGFEYELSQLRQAISLHSECRDAAAASPRRRTIPITRVAHQLLFQYLGENKMVSVLAVLNAFSQMEVKPDILANSTADAPDIIDGNQESGSVAKQVLRPTLGQVRMQASTSVDVWNRNKYHVEVEAFAEPEPEPPEDPNAVLVTDLTQSEEEVKEREMLPHQLLHPRPDGKSLGGLPHAICTTVLDVEEGELHCLAPTQDGFMFAGGFADSSVAVWRSDGKDFSVKLHSSNDTFGETASVSTLELVGHRGPVFATAWLPTAPDDSSPPAASDSASATTSAKDDNNRARTELLLSSSEDGSTRLWHTGTGSCVAEYTGHKHSVWALDTSPDGYFFATGGRDRTARLWCTQRTIALRVLPHSADVQAVRCHPGGHMVASESQLLVTAASDNVVRVWDMRERRQLPVRALHGHRQGVNALAISPNGRFIASAGRDLTVLIWDIADQRCLGCLHGHTDDIWSLAFSAQGRLLASAGLDCTVRLWDVTATTTLEPPKPGAKPSNRALGMPLCKVLRTKCTPIYCAAFTPLNLLLVGGPFLNQS